jgi:ATP-dependent Clp protease adapter protein ClpS
MIGPVEATPLPFWLAQPALPSMALPGTLELPVQEPVVGEGKAWIVTVFDNDYNTYEEVMMILMAATGCSAQEAYIEAWEIDHLGKSVVHTSTEDDCRVAASIIGEIGIKVEVSKS